MMLDEIDKLGRGIQGDPSSALLEVSTPRRTDLPRQLSRRAFDLSKVLFIATANQLDTIPGPLLDRMEVIQLSGYTISEKLEIARRYLVPRQRQENGLTAEQCEIADAALRTVITDYTREAGVRNLERAIGSVFRRAAPRRQGRSRMRIDVADLAEILGAALRGRGGAAHQRAGVATGMLDAGRRRHPVHRGHPRPRAASSS